MNVVVFKDGSYMFIEGQTWEWENEEDWLVTIPLQKFNG